MATIIVKEFYDVAADDEFLCTGLDDPLPEDQPPDLKPLSDKGRSMDARAILDKLVSFQTVSNVSNLDLIDWVEDYLKGHDVSATRVYNDEGNKASLYANVGPEVDGGDLGA